MIIMPQELDMLQNFAKELDFNYIILPVKIRDIHKTEQKKRKKKRISINFFDYENKGRYPTYVSESTSK